MGSDLKKNKLPLIEGDTEEAVATITTELRQDLFSNLSKIVGNKFVSREAKQKLAVILESFPEEDL